MYLAHYLLPFVILYSLLYLEKSKKNNKVKFKEVIKYIFDYKKNLNDSKFIIFWGLILANLIDLDHIYYRIIGKVGWLSSACAKRFTECSFGIYPLHSLWMLFILIIITPLIFVKKNWIRFIGFLGVGGLIHFFLDYVMFKTGYGI